jgi:hypothetical protein
MPAGENDPVELFESRKLGVKRSRVTGRGRNRGPQKNGQTQVAQL